jgi:DNA-binding MarR family transcriptional regulator
MSQEPPLTEAQTKMLEWLDRHGAVSPSQILAQTEIAPSEFSALLVSLSEMGLVVLRDDPDSPDGKLVVPVPRYSNMAQQSAPITKMMRDPGRSSRS